MNARPTIHVFADVLFGFGGIESYLDALVRRLAAEEWPVRVAVSLNAQAPFLDALEALGVPIYRQPRVPGDRWHVRQRLLVRHVAASIAPGDWVYCVRQPMPEIYLPLVQAIHARGGRVAASWMYAPEFFPPPPGRTGESFKRAVAETDVVISVSECTRSQFERIYGYTGPVAVVRYHNLDLMPATVPLPAAPPFRIGFLGRIDIWQKNLDTILESYRRLAARRADLFFDFYGGGQDLESFRQMVLAAGLNERVTLHGAYNHRRDLASIIAANHLFVYTSRFEGGPCFSLLELLQAGRFVVTSPVGGIPDIYAGRPEIGTMVDCADADAICCALDDAVGRLETGRIAPERIRAVYTEHFHENVAHRQWLVALAPLQTTQRPVSTAHSTILKQMNH